MSLGAVSKNYSIKFLYYMLIAVKCGPFKNLKDLKVAQLVNVINTSNSNSGSGERNVIQEVEVLTGAKLLVACPQGYQFSSQNFTRIITCQISGRWLPETIPDCTSKWNPNFHNVTIMSLYIFFVKLRLNSLIGTSMPLKIIKKLSKLVILIIITKRVK